MNHLYGITIEKSPIELKFDLEELAILILKYENSKDIYNILTFYLDGERKELDLEEFFKNLKSLGSNYLKSIPYSLRLSNIQNHSSQIKAISRKLGEDKGAAYTCNLYFTPGSDRNCFDFHTDFQESYVYQLMGQKRWMFPLKDSEVYRNFSISHQHQETLGLVKKLNTYDVVLSSGDFLYVPYAYYHKAKAEGDECSVHLTYSCEHPTYRDIVFYIVENLSEKLNIKERAYEKLEDDQIREIFEDIFKNISSLDKNNFLDKFQESKMKKTLEHLKSGRPYASGFHKNAD